MWTDPCKAMPINFLLMTRATAVADFAFPVLERSVYEQHPTSYFTALLKPHVLIF